MLDNDGGKSMTARKKSGRKAAGASREHGAQALRDSAQKIWLAGLGAFERAKLEGPKMFEALVSQGREFRGRAREAADQAFKAVRAQAGEAQGRWDKLEQVFEDRVARSLNRLGVLTQAELGDLSKQVHDLNESMRTMMRGRAKAPARKGKAKTKAKARRTRKAAKRR
jgi:poly(hydroxyalkanoate) granule-associated protein